MHCCLPNYHTPSLLPNRIPFFQISTPPSYTHIFIGSWKNPQVSGKFKPIKEIQYLPCYWYSYLTCLGFQKWHFRGKTSEEDFLSGHYYPWMQETDYFTSLLVVTYAKYDVLTRLRWSFGLPLSLGLSGHFSFHSWHYIIVVRSITHNLRMRKHRRPWRTITLTNIRNCAPLNCSRSRPWETGREPLKNVLTVK